MIRNVQKNVPVTFYPHDIDEGVEEDLQEGDALREDEPVVDHLDVGGRW